MIMRKIVNVIMVVFLLLALNNNGSSEMEKEQKLFNSPSWCNWFLGDLGGGKDIGSIGPKEL